jgi:hypothetical protein
VFLLLCAAYVILTRPSLQKSILVKQLPEGSTLDYVQVTMGGLELENFSIQADDGSRIQVKRLETKFSIWDAAFNQTINLGVLEIDGLDVELVGTDSTSEKPVTETSSVTASEETPMDPLEYLYQLGESEWLLKVERININGRIRAVSGNEIKFALVSDEIAPGKSSELSFNLNVDAAELRDQGIRSMQSSLVLGVSQKTQGGFEDLSVQTKLSGYDASDALLLSFAQTAKIRVDDAAEQAVLESDFSLSFAEA